MKEEEYIISLKPIREIDYGYEYPIKAMRYNE